MSRNKCGFWSALITAILFLSRPAAANQCDDLRDAAPRIVACTQNINSGKWKGHNQAINYNNRGIAYDDNRDFDRAIADYNHAISLDPKYAFAYNNRGIAYRAKGDYDRAIADYNQAISLDPKDANAYNNRGNAYDDKRDFDRAIADYNQAISLDPKYANAYNNRGNAYDAKGDRDRAIADYNHAISLDPNDALAYNNRGVAYKDKGDYDRAIADYTQAIQINPRPDSDTHINVYSNRGVAYKDKGDYDRAIADYDQAIQIDPKYAIAYDNRGLAYRAKGDYDRAIADYDQAIRLDPKYAPAYGNRGIAYYAKGDDDRAAADFDQAIQIDPKNTFAYSNRGRANLYAGALPKALADLDQATALDPKYAYAALWLDIVAQRSNVSSRLSQATAAIDMTKWPAPVIRMFLGQLTPAAVLAAADDPDATKKKGQVCEANFYSGELALRQGKKDEAKRLFETAADGCPRTFVEWDAANAELKALGEIRPHAEIKAPDVAAANQAVAQRVVLYEEDTNNADGDKVTGSAAWRTHIVSPASGLAPELEVRADITIPDLNMTATWTMRPNTDQSLPVSYIIEIMFNLPPRFPHGGIASVPSVMLKPSGQEHSTPLVGDAVKVTNNFFLIGLSDVAADEQRNIKLLKDRPWFDIPLVYTDGTRALISMEKGEPGERAFADAFAAWRK